MKKAQVQTSFYLTQNLRDLSRFLHKREEITKVVFYRRALKYYFEVDGTVDPKVLITERSHPDYIRRDAVETVKIDIDLKAQIEELALEKTIQRDRSYSWQLLIIVHYYYRLIVPELPYKER